MSEPFTSSFFVVLRKFWTRIVRAAGTKYFIVLAAAIVWILLFDRYNIPAQLNMADQIAQEKADEQWYLHELESLDQQRARFETNEEELERIAREKYLMSKPGEVVYLVEE